MSVLQTESEAVIVQRALGLAESANRFDSLEDDTTEAREGRLRYDIRRRTVLEALDWNYARRRVLGTAVTASATPDAQPYAYALPPQTLRIRGVRAGGVSASWSRENVIYASLPDAQIVYTIDEQNPVLFPPVFTSALEFLLAADFAMIFARSVNRSKIMLKNFRDTMRDADEMEGQERSNDCAYETGGWVDAIELPWSGVRS